MLAAARNRQARGHQPLLRRAAAAAAAVAAAYAVSAAAAAAAAAAVCVGRRAVGISVHADAGRAPAHYDLVIHGLELGPGLGPGLRLGLAGPL